MGLGFGLGFRVEFRVRVVCSVRLGLDLGLALVVVPSRTRNDGSELFVMVYLLHGAHCHFQFGKLKVTVRLYCMVHILIFLFSVQHFQFAKLKIKLLSIAWYIFLF